MRVLTLVLGLALAGCVTTEDASPEVQARCGDDYQMLRVGMPEDLMLLCSFAPGKPYLKGESVIAGHGRVRTFSANNYVPGGMSIYTQNGKVVAWFKGR